jgi:SAM-dependent methyltransferase
MVVGPLSATSEKPKSLGGGLESKKMPGHFLLARLGKRVLRPGGRELTGWLVDTVGLDRSDRVVEFGPGLGATARILLACEPASYTGVERDETAANVTRDYLVKDSQGCVVASAESTGLPQGESTVVIGEAMLTMQREQRKREIVAEAWRLLAPGGRYAIHELAFVPDDVDPAVEDEVAGELSKTIHVGARPLTAAAWRQMLSEQGFTVRDETIVPMALLEPRRLIEDEGFRVLRIAANLLRDRDARKRVMGMRRVFRRHSDHLVAIGMVAIKPE